MEWDTIDKGGIVLVGLNKAEKYAIVCGYTDTECIVYDPANDKYESYKFDGEYDLFKAYMPIGIK